MGVESGVYEQVRESTFNSYVMFATDSEKRFNDIFL